jgi:hypothetical protein
LVWEWCRLILDLKMVNRNVVVVLVWNIGSGLHLTFQIFILFIWIYIRFIVLIYFCTSYFGFLYLFTAFNLFVCLFNYYHFLIDILFIYNFNCFQIWISITLLIINIFFTFLRNQSIRINFWVLANWVLSVWILTNCTLAHSSSFINRRSLFWVWFLNKHFLAENFWFHLNSFFIEFLLFIWLVIKLICQFINILKHYFLYITIIWIRDIIVYLSLVAWLIFFWRLSSFDWLFEILFLLGIAYIWVSSIVNQ